MSNPAYIDPSWVITTYRGKQRCCACGCKGHYSTPDERAGTMRVVELNRRIAEAVFSDLWPLPSGVVQQWAELTTGDNRCIRVYFDARFLQGVK